MLKYKKSLSWEGGSPSPRSGAKRPRIPIFYAQKLAGMLLSRRNRWVGQKGIREGWDLIHGEERRGQLCTPAKLLGCAVGLHSLGVWVGSWAPQYKAAGVQEICPAGYFCPEGTGERVRKGLERGVRLGPILWEKRGTAGYRNKATGVQEISPVGTGEWVRMGSERGVQCGLVLGEERRGQLCTTLSYEGWRRRGSIEEGFSSPP